MVQSVKNMPAMQQTRVQSLGQAMATHSNILAWEIPWTEEPGGLQSMGSQRVGLNLPPSHWQCMKVLISPYSHQPLLLSVFFNYSHVSWCEMVSHCGFDLHFPDGE